MESATRTVAVSALSFGIALAAGLFVPAPEARAGDRVRPSLRFQETYRERLVRYREEGDSYIEVASSETFKIKAVIPFDRDFVDFASFDQDTEFYFEVGEAYYAGVLGDDPHYAPGDRSARIVMEEEEIWNRSGEDSRMRPVSIVTLKWSKEKWTVAIVQRPYVDSSEWEDDGSFIAAPIWTDPEDLESESGELLLPHFSEDIEGYFSLGKSVMAFAGRYAGVSKTRTVVIGPEGDEEEFDLANVRLRGSGTPWDYSEDIVDPAVSIGTVEALRDDAGALTGLYVSGNCQDWGSGIHAVTARVDGGPNVVIWFEDLSDWIADAGVADAYFGSVVPVASPSGTVVITVYDRAKNSAEVLIPYGSP